MRAMGIGGLLNNRNAAAADAQMRHQLQQTMHMDPHPSYALDHQPTLAHHAHPHAMTQQSHMAFANMGAAQHHQMIPAAFMTPHTSNAGNAHLDTDQIKPKTEPAPKAFACSTCSKGFARRSDLARHERIHSGVRPHACDFPGCGKQFIQRSALTVHARVHTGEKPHMCERCGKPFSDSSSLARHRRIHSGKRPYKCPFANCQKTFTRRTTLTRHQNHHTGTVEQAEAETNAKLASTQPQSQPRSANSSYSDAASRHSTVSPTRPMSISPNHDMQNMPNLQKSHSEFSYLSQAQLLPPHMRGEFPHQVAARSTQPMNTPSMTAFTSGPQSVPAMTSHPSGFRPPQAHEQSSAGGNEETASPHINGLNWASPSHGGISSPNGLDPYSYQDQSYGGQPLYYQGSNIRRPQSIEPEDYSNRSRFMGHHLNTGAMPMTSEWSSMPMNMHEIKTERTFAG